MSVRPDASGVRTGRSRPTLDHLLRALHQFSLVLILNVFLCVEEGVCEWLSYKGV